MLFKLERALFGVDWLMPRSSALEFRLGIDVEVIPADVVGQLDLSDHQVTDLILQQWQRQMTERLPSC